jgi:prefoldin subunit 5
MSAIDPTQAADLFKALKDRFERLRDDARFPDITRELDNLVATIRALPDDIAKLRTRGYIFASYLENKADVLQREWDDARAQVHQAINREQADIRPTIERVERAIERGENLVKHPSALVNQLPVMTEDVNDLEREIGAAKLRMRDRFERLQTNTQQATSELQKFNTYLDRKEQASFDFLAGESVFIADEAEWIATNKASSNPDGVLYLTDQRLIFEQKETTGKTLGLFGGKKVQALQWALPLNQVGEAAPENKGLFGGKDLVHLKLMSGAPYAEITVEIKGGVQAKFWAAQIMRMIRGEVQSERTVELSPDVAEALRNAPTECPVCGATLPPLVAGQRQINCTYCGTLVRVS